jgi:hypothetical protein
MIISGYAWGHIVAFGSWQLHRDIRVIDTHPRPLYRRKAFDGFSGAVLAATAVAPPESLWWRLGSRQFHPFHLK